jgi:hypothetical protein
LIVNVAGVDNRVAVGLEQPTEQLHTNGGVRFEGLPPLSSPPRIVVQDINGVLGYAPFNIGNVNLSCAVGNFVPKVNPSGNNDLICSDIIDVNGRVGIGTASPATKLHVNGQSLFLTGGNGNGIATGSGNGLRLFGDNANQRSQIFSYNYSQGQPTPLLLQLPGGSVGIGLTPGTWTGGGSAILGNPGTPSIVRLDVSGMVRANTAVFTSDLRYKQNVKTLTNATESLSKLRGVSYTWKTSEFPDKMFDSYEHYGFIAQEVLEVLPEVVGEDSEGYLSVEYLALIPVLVEAIKEQNIRINQLELLLEINNNSLEPNQIIGNIEVNDNNQNTPVLYQNRPNPFNDRTTISYSLDKEYSQQMLVIMNLNGQILKKAELNGSPGQLNEVIIETGGLSEGTYIYSLILDGVESGSKKMVLLRQ